MDCREVRDLVEAYVSEQVLVETAQAVAAHVDRCPPCRAEVEGLRRLRASVRSAYLGSSDLAPGVEFTAALRGRLRAEVPRDPRARSWRRGWLAVAATVTLIVGGGLGLDRVGFLGFSAIVDAAVGDHRYCVVTFRLTERPITLEDAAVVYDDAVNRSLAAVQPSFDRLSGGPIRILERHSCVFHGRRFAHLVVRYKGALASVVVTPDDRLLRHLPGAAPPGNGSIAILHPVDGFQVAAFRGPHHAVFVVSTLAADDVRAVAEAMAGPVLRAMNGA